MSGDWIMFEKNITIGYHHTNRYTWVPENHGFQYYKIAESNFGWFGSTPMLGHLHIFIWEYHADLTGEYGWIWGFNGYVMMILGYGTKNLRFGRLEMGHTAENNYWTGENAWTVGWRHSFQRTIPRDALFCLLHGFKRVWTVLHKLASCRGYLPQCFAFYISFSWDIHGYSI